MWFHRYNDLSLGAILEGFSTKVSENYSAQGDFIWGCPHKHSTRK